MSGSAIDYIHVWEVYASDCGEELEWRLREMTGEYVGTRDELKYFRMINEHGKNFFMGPHDYLAFSGATLDDEDSCYGLSDVVAAWHARVSNEPE